MTRRRGFSSPSAALRPTSKRSRCTRVLIRRPLPGLPSAGGAGARPTSGRRIPVSLRTVTTWASRTAGDRSGGRRRSLGRSVCNLLRARGFPTEAFPSAEEFLTFTRREIVGCLVLDLRMSGVSDLDLLRHLRAAEDQIPVVILMAQGDEGARQQCLEAGAAAFLVKPFRAEMLLARIRSTLK